MISSHEEIVKGILSKTDSKGILKSRESNTVEFKENYNKANISAYAKTMASFANHQGGYIIFGVKDKPNKVVGLKNDNFENLNQEQFTDVLNNYFSPAIEWETGVTSIEFLDTDIQVKQKNIGWIYTYEAENKPIIAQKNIDSEKVSNGDVLYRYRARTQKIKSAEMQKIISDGIKRERERVYELIERIKNADTTHLGIVNYTNGRFSTPYGIDVEFDRKLVAKVLKKARFIKEGSFNEKEGAPVIKVTGNIDLSEPSDNSSTNPDISHPYIQKQLASTLKTNPFDIQALILHFHLKEDKKYHIEITTGAKTSTHKFSESALQFLKEKIAYYKEHPDELKEIRKEYSAKKTKKKGKTHG